MSSSYFKSLREKPCGVGRAVPLLELALKISRRLLGVFIVKECVNGIQNRRRRHFLLAQTNREALSHAGIEVGLLLRGTPDGGMTRTLVAGRVMYGETVREALFRHLEKDLGPMAFPLIPSAAVPAHVAEYFPMPGISPYVDERQHAVSLVFVVPVTGTCDPRQDALEVTWVTPQQALADDIVNEMESGRGALLRAALASVSS